jgi:RNA polymerase sigma-70 factor (ECF subfamily)
VDRFLGLVLHVVNHTAECRSLHLSFHDREDLVAEVFLALVDNDFAVLRRFRGDSSLATYLTVIARRVIVREITRRTLALSSVGKISSESTNASRCFVSGEQRINDRDELERLLAHLNEPEAAVVRMYHLEGKSYREISDRVGMPENSIGPTLSRARSKMRRANADSNF